MAFGTKEDIQRSLPKHTWGELMWEDTLVKEWEYVEVGGTSLRVCYKMSGGCLNIFVACWALRFSNDEDGPGGTRWQDTDYVRCFLTAKSQFDDGLWSFNFTHPMLDSPSEFQQRNISSVGMIELFTAIHKIELCFCKKVGKYYKPK